jgi:nicotinamidase/pyrazinamidase
MTSAKSTTVALLLIDVQKDFHPNGSLAIPNADQDAQRIATLICKHGSNLDRIIATLDSHHPLHIAHPSFWVSGDGDDDDVISSEASKPKTQQQHPSPFTIISADDIRNGVWKPRSDIMIDPSLLDPNIFNGTDTVMDNTTNKLDLQKYCLEYAMRLEQAGRFQLCIWPEHCLMGSVGYGVVDDVLQAMNEWSRSTGRSVEYVQKGQNLLTEMYSALAADVPVTADTDLNQTLLSSLQDCNRLVVCGQAMSHCVNYTLRDIVKHWPKNRLKDITLLTDCASAVPGFEAAANDFQNDMVAAGVQLKTTNDLEW